LVTAVDGTVGVAANPPFSQIERPMSVILTAQSAYLLFYDWDKPVITPEGQVVLQLTVQRYFQSQVPSIQVVGNTDTAYSNPVLALKLSIQIAERVRDELVREGIPKETIKVHGMGDKKLRVSTPQGVREPQNRRVEILIGE
jgi:OmpA-OmpF porin, OOP family